jgi:hypothetical protein
LINNYKENNNILKDNELLKKAVLKLNKQLMEKTQINQNLIKENVFMNEKIKKCELYIISNEQSSKLGNNFKY